MTGEADWAPGPGTENPELQRTARHKGLELHEPTGSYPSPAAPAKLTGSERPKHARAQRHRLPVQVPMGANKARVVGEENEADPTEVSPCTWICGGMLTPTGTRRG